MNKKISSALLSLSFIVLFVCTPVFGSSMEGSRWMKLGGEEGMEPSITVLGSNAERTTIEVDIPGFWVKDREVSGEIFHELSIPGQTTVMVVGEPAVPVIRFLVAVPAGARITMSSRTDGSRTLDGFRIYPFQEPTTDNSNNQPEFMIDRIVYESSDPYPSNTVEKNDPSTWRHLDVVQVEVSPLKFLPAEGRLSVVTSVTVELAYAAEHEGDVLDASIGRVRPHWDRLYKRHVVNYDWLEKRRDQGRTGGPVYLIITHPNFEPSIQPLADWHNKEGMETEVVTITTSNAQTIKNEISDRYDQGNLEYVLLVGDSGYIPVYNWSTIPSDYWYACITGSPDYYADVALGRLAVNNTSQAEDQVAKILAYEKNPPLDEWLNDVILVAHSEDAPLKYVQCKENIRTTIIPQPPYAVETAYGHQPSGTNATVQAAIDAGCQIVNYRGHGDIQEWWAWDYNGASWYTTQVAQLFNNDRTPIVFNIACSCHDITATCLGEAWLNKYPGGAVASLGATEPSYTTPNHDYDKELFRQFGMYGEYRIGWMSNAAATLIVNQHGSIGRDNAKMYLWLGDPATEVWTAIPEALTVDHPAAIDPGEQNFDVTVTSSGNPVEGATVCLTNSDDVYEVMATGSDGVASFSFTTSSGNTIDVTVSQHDYLPYEGEITAHVPNVAIVLTPDAVSFPRGSDMGYTVQATNGETTPQSVDYWAEVFLPGGEPFAGNPVFGPVTVTIPAGASPSAHLTHFIPTGAPMVTYTYKGYIGTYDSQVWQEDSFDFSVTE